jgi:saccharopine dehydrogenase (NADP+, L-glutamate forming)
MKRVLVLGAGMVSRPLVQYLLEQPDYQVRIASRTRDKATRLIGGRPNGEAIGVDITREGELESLVAESDLAISLLPYAHHRTVALACIAHGKHLVTTSYVQAPMRELDGAARDAGVMVLNEVGLDPGIDHMSAMQIIHDAQSAGGKVVRFSSYCGGLPALEANTNPFGYKFSWSPRGVLLAGRNAARFLRDGAVVEIPGEELFDHHWTVQINGLGQFEGYPNRDSLPYLDTYGIPDASGIFRGTLRYVGWCSTLKKFVELGLLSDDDAISPQGLTWAQFMARLIDASGRQPIRQEAAGFLQIPASAPELERMAWLGLFDDAPTPAGALSPLDALVQQMLQKMQYAPGERDMVILKHQFTIEYPDRSEEITSTLIDYGIPGGDSSMARTVGLPAAIATRLILEGKIELTGVHTPVRPEIYRPILAELAQRGIVFEETRAEFRPTD